MPIPRRRALAAAALLAAAAVAAAPTGDPSLVKLGLELDAAEAALHTRSDSAAVERLWSEEFLVTNIFGTLLTRQQAMERVKKGLITFASLTRTVEHARKDGDLLFTVGTEEATGGPGSVLPAGKTVQARYTHVWRREAGTWRLWVRHASIPIPDPGER
jgi:ketosteroid isomerase-like protein